LVFIWFCCGLEYSQYSQNFYFRNNEDVLNYDEINAWSNRDEYAADLHFLEQRIWPGVKEKQISHDSYCCDRFPNTRPFPTRRASTYQHVGQVFDCHDNARMMDIDGFIRGVPIPVSCRKTAEWIYG
jgi:hypothetical protein